MQASSHTSDLTLRWRLSAELVALIVWRLFPDVQLAGGGVNSLGFYYDFVFRQPLTKEMLELIDVELYRFVKEDHPIRYLSIMRENAQSLFTHHKHLKLAERAGQEECNILELLQVGDFYGICPVLALESTLEAGHIKLLDCYELAQDETQEDAPRSTRLIGTSQMHAKELKSFVKTYEAFLKKRDHRTLGPKLNLFSFSESMGALGVVWHPKGMRLRRILQEWLDKKTLDSAMISTPLALREDFLSLSTQTIEPFHFEGRGYVLRPSFLPQHLTHLKSSLMDSEELPWKVTEAGNVFHFFPHSQWWGLFCTSTFHFDQTTVCCKREQVVSELISSLRFIEQIITIFGFKAHWILVVGRVKSPKNRQAQEAIEWLKQAFYESGCRLPLAPDWFEEVEGETPRLELRISDAIGREWAASGVRIVTASSEVKAQYDLLEAHARSSLVVFTRHIWGSLERFVGLLLEHYEGILPFWLAPEQVRLFAIGAADRGYAQEVGRRMEQKGLRVRLDLRQSKLGGRIHEAEIENVPYLVIVGEQERLKQKISVRAAGKAKDNQLVDLETFLKAILIGESESA